MQLPLRVVGEGTMGIMAIEPPFLDIGALRVSVKELHMRQALGLSTHTHTRTHTHLRTHTLTHNAKRSFHGQI